MQNRNEDEDDADLRAVISLQLGDGAHQKAKKQTDAPTRDQRLHRSYQSKSVTKTIAANSRFKSTTRANQSNRSSYPT